MGAENSQFLTELKLLGYNSLDNYINVCTSHQDADILFTCCRTNWITFVEWVSFMAHLRFHISIYDRYISSITWTVIVLTWYDVFIRDCYNLFAPNCLPYFYSVVYMQLAHYFFPPRVIAHELQRFHPPRSAKLYIYVFFLLLLFREAILLFLGSSRFSVICTFQ